MAQIPVWEKAIFFVSFQKSSLGSLSCMAKVHPLHAGVGVNLILPARAMPSKLNL